MDVDGKFVEFVKLSSAITGFSRVDLEGTGVAEQYWNTLVKETTQSTIDALLAAWEEVEKSTESQETAVREKVFNNVELRTTAQTLLKMWYTGQWGDNALSTVSSEAYQQGLVWNVIKAHPAGAKQPGFGTWSFPPNSLGNVS